MTIYEFVVSFVGEVPEAFTFIYVILTAILSLIIISCQMLLYNLFILYYTNIFLMSNSMFCPNCGILKSKCICSHNNYVYSIF